MKNKATKLMLSILLGLGLFAISDASQAWYYGRGYWNGGYYHGGYWRGYNRGYYGARCGWIQGHWRNGYWVPGHRVCWR